MGLQRRKWRRRLRRALWDHRGRPSLVLPVPEIGRLPDGLRFDSLRGVVSDAPRAHFLFDAPEVGLRRKGLRLPAPSDAEWLTQHRALWPPDKVARLPHVTYDPVGSAKRLMQIMGCTRLERNPIVTNRT